jgi:hypothetical protein
MKSANRSFSAWLLILILLSVILRFFMVLASAPIYNPSSDAPEYIDLSKKITKCDLSGDNGARMPGYPLFLTLVGIHPSRIRVMQMMLGILTTMLVFLITWQITRHGFFSFVAGSFYGFNLSQIAFESMMLSETLSTFLVMASIALFLFVWKNHFHHGNKNLLLLGAGSFAALAGFTRPIYAILPFLLIVAGYVVFNPKVLESNSEMSRASLFKSQAFKMRFKKLVNGLIPIAAALSPAVILIGGWSLFNYLRLDYFGPSTLLGFNLTNHSGGFIEYAPDRYEEIRDIYVKARRARIAKAGTHSMTIWRAYPEMMRKTGLQFPELSKKLARMSVGLFAHYPLLYAKSAIKSWIQFWNEMSFRYWVGAGNQKTGETIGVLWRFEKIVLVFFNFLFLLIAASSLIAFLLKRKKSWLMNSSSVALAILIILFSIIQALLENGENARYSLQMKPLVAIVVFTTFQKIFISKDRLKTNEV